MSKYLMNKLIHLVNMDEEAEKEYKANPREFVEKWEKTQKLKLETGRARSAGDQGLRQTLRARRPSVHALEFHRGGLGRGKTARRTRGGLQSQSRQSRLPEF